MASKKLKGVISINEDDVKEFFKEIHAAHKDMGMWQSQGTMDDKSDDEFVLPNKLRLNKELGDRWVEWYRAQKK